MIFKTEIMSVEKWQEYSLEGEENVVWKYAGN